MFCKNLYLCKKKIKLQFVEKMNIQLAESDK